MESVFDNIVNNVELKDLLTQAFDDLDRILTAHSGPFATNCVIGSKYRQHNDVDEFTKDGIKILRHLIVSNNPVERFAARLARFVGITVDNRCHDGTTTSMLTFCRLAKQALLKLDSNPVSGEQYYWMKGIEDTLQLCLEEIDHLKITEDDILARCKSLKIKTSIEDVRGSLAYHMAMISSKGDHDLSWKISQVIRSCPDKIYGIFKNIRLAVETEERYILKKQEYDLSIDGNLGNMTDYNYKNDTQFLAENAVIFATASEIVNDSMESLFLKALISENPKDRADLAEFGCKEGWEAMHKGKHHLVIISPLLNDPGLMTIINLFNGKNPNVKISWVNIHVHGRLRTSLNKTLHYIAGVPLFKDVMLLDPTRSFIGFGESKVRAHLIGNTLTLTGLYKKDGEVFHPLYRNPEAFPDYTEFADQTKELILFARENISNPGLDQDEVTYLTSLYRSLTCQEVYDIEVGGSAHDQYANQTVYEDAIGAALSAVDEGVVLGGYAQLAHYFKSRLTLNDREFERYEDQISSVFSTIVEDSLRVKRGDAHTTHVIMSGVQDKWAYVSADTNAYLTSVEPKNYVSKHKLDKKTLQMFLTREPTVTILFQAYSGYHEQFRRCKDILPRLANTMHLADMRAGDDPNVQ